MKKRYFVCSALLFIVGLIWFGRSFEEKRASDSMKNRIEGNEMVEKDSQISVGEDADHLPPSSPTPGLMTTANNNSTFTQSTARVNRASSLMTTANNGSSYAQTSAQNSGAKSSTKHTKATDRSVSKNKSSLSKTGQYKAEQPIDFAFLGLNLRADSLALQHDLKLTATALNLSQLPMLKGSMTNVTAQARGYRLLPHGFHFDQEHPATIGIAYELYSLPQGFHPNDIYSYYYDTMQTQWIQLARIDVDTLNHMVYSSVTHFTDFINAVIRTPDMPEVSAFVPTQAVDLPTPSPLQNIPMVQQPQVNSMGTAEVTYPIEIPAGRNGLQPDVNLYYSSGSGNGILGYGWSIRQPAITIDTRWGVPRYDANKETEIYMLDGTQLVMLSDNNEPLPLPFQTSTLRDRPLQKEDSVIFKVRDVNNANKVIRHGTSPKDYWWEVIDRQGTRYYYGKYKSDTVVNKNCILKDANENIGYWALAEVVDLSGNFMRYEYVKGRNEIYPKNIYYTGNHDTKDTARYCIFFHYDIRPDVIRDGRLGFIRQTDSVCCYMNVGLMEYKNKPTDTNHVNHVYLFTYDIANGSTESQISKVEDFVTRDGCSWYDNHKYDCDYFIKHSHDDGLPDFGLNGTVTFDYNGVDIANMFGKEEKVYKGSEVLGKSRGHNYGIGGAVTVGLGPDSWETNISAGGNYNHGWSQGQTEQMMLDYDGDGLPDLMYIKDGEICYRPQVLERGQMKFGGEQKTGISAKYLTYDATQSDNWGLQAGVELGVANANVSGGGNYTDTYTSTYFADVNGDGLPDFVDDGRVWLNGTRTKGRTAVEIPVDSTTFVLDTLLCPNANTFYPSGEVIDVRKPQYEYKIISGYSKKVCVGKGVFDLTEEECCIPSVEQNWDDVFATLKPECIEGNPYPDFQPVNFQWYRDNQIINGATGANYYCADCPSILKNGGVPPTFYCVMRDANGVQHSSCPVTLQPFTGSGNPIIITPDAPPLVPCTPSEKLSPCVQKNQDKIKRFHQWQASMRAKYPGKTVQFEQHGNVWYAYIFKTVGSRTVKKLKDDPNPNIEAVRVWVVPDDGRINLSSTVKLLEDKSDNRHQSRYADGVTCVIQHNYNITAGYQSLMGNSTNIYTQFIGADDYTPHTYNTSIDVHRGDIFFFRLKSNTTHQFDKVNWDPEIKYTDYPIYRPRYNFTCYSLNDAFTSSVKGKLDIDISVTMDRYSSRGVLTTKRNGKEEYLIRSFEATTYHQQLDISPNDSVYIEVSDLLENLSVPKIIPRYTFTPDISSDVPVFQNYLVPRIKHLGIEGPHGRYQAPTVYYDLFGPLFQGWGQFAYNNAFGLDIIPLEELENTAKVYAETLEQKKLDNPNYSESDFIQSITFTDTAQLKREGALQSLFTANKLYQPIQDGAWIPMFPDLENFRWEAYGRVARIGRTLQSNTKEVKTALTGLTKLKDNAPQPNCPIIHANEDGYCPGDIMTLTCEHPNPTLDELKYYDFSFYQIIDGQLIQTEATCVLGNGNGLNCRCQKYHTGILHPTISPSHGDCGCTTPPYLKPYSDKKISFFIPDTLPSGDYIVLIGFSRQKDISTQYTPVYDNDGNLIGLKANIEYPDDYVFTRVQFHVNHGSAVIERKNDSTLRVNVQGNQFQWYKDGSIIPASEGGTNAELIMKGSGEYFCLIDDTRRTCPRYIVCPTCDQLDLFQIDPNGYCPGEIIPIPYISPKAVLAYSYLHPSLVFASNYPGLYLFDTIGSTFYMTAENLQGQNYGKDDLRREKKVYFYLRDESDIKEAPISEVTIKYRIKPSIYLKSTNDSITVNLVGNTYQWYRNDKIIDGAKSRTIKLNIPGEYYCKIDGIMSCSEYFTPAAYMEKDYDRNGYCPNDYAIFESSYRSAIQYKLSFPNREEYKILAKGNTTSWKSVKNGKVEVRIPNDCPYGLYEVYVTFKKSSKIWPTETKLFLVNHPASRIRVCNNTLSIIDIPNIKSYRWYKDGKIISTNPTAQFTQNETATYYCLIDRGNGWEKVCPREFHIIYTPPQCSADACFMPGGNVNIICTNAKNITAYAIEFPEDAKYDNFRKDNDIKNKNDLNWKYYVLDHESITIPINAPTDCHDGDYEVKVHLFANYIPLDDCEDRIETTTIVEDLHFKINSQWNIQVNDACADDETVIFKPGFSCNNGTSKIKFLFDNNAKQQGFKDTIVDFVSGSSSISIPIPKKPGSHVRPDKYDCSVTLLDRDTNAIPSSSKDLSFTLFYPTTVLDQHYNDFVAVLNTNYNGGYDFTTFDWYVNNKRILNQRNSYLYASDVGCYFTIGDVVIVYLQRKGENYYIPTCPLIISDVEGTYSNQNLFLNPNNTLSSPNSNAITSMLDTSHFLFEDVANMSDSASISEFIENITENTPNIESYSPLPELASPISTDLASPTLRVSDSNTSDIEFNIPTFDSDIPFVNGSNAKVVRKVARSTQYNINAGAGVMTTGSGITYADASYTILTDFTDLNGDGFPDIVHENQVQYTQPWGGLDNTTTGTNNSPYTNLSTTDGVSISGNFSNAEKLSSNNPKDGKFTNHLSGSVGANVTTTTNHSTIAYLDVNNDGLPDKITKNNNSVKAYLNIGYKFDNTAITLKDIHSIDINTSIAGGPSLGGNAEVLNKSFEGFTKNNNKMKGSFQMSIAAGADFNVANNQTDYRLIDMNGDGILDVVQATEQGCNIYLMTQNGAMNNNRPIHAKGQIQTSQTSSYSTHLAVTGGGSICFMALCIKICGGANGTPVGASYTETLSDIMDMDGDGYPDLVWADNNGIHVKYNNLGHAKNRLLKTITNPTGQQIKIDYTLSEPTSEQRGRQWLMTKVENVDNNANTQFTATRYAQSFEYKDPHYDRGERQFYGYGATYVHDLNTLNNDAIYRTVYSNYQNQDYTEHGKLKYQLTYDANRKPYREYEIGTYYYDPITQDTISEKMCGQATLWSAKEVHYNRFYEPTGLVGSVPPYEGDKGGVSNGNVGDTRDAVDGNGSVTPPSSTSWNEGDVPPYEGDKGGVSTGGADGSSAQTPRVGTPSHGLPRIVTMKEYQYDRYHNVTTYVNHGDSALMTDNLMAKIEYDTAGVDTNNLVSNPKTLTVSRDTSGTDSVYRIEATYNDRGLLTQTKQTDLTIQNGKTMTTDYEYNKLGQLSKVTLPATDSTGKKRAYTKIEYNDYAHTMPTKITDQWGRTSTTTYDKMQHILTQTDPAGQTFAYQYDTWWRPSQVKTPKGKIEYAYSLQDHLNMKKAGNYSVKKQAHDTKNNLLQEATTICDKRGQTMYNQEKTANGYRYADMHKTDAFGRTVTVYKNQTSLKQEPLTTHTYDILDRPLSLIYQDGNKQTYQYSLGEDVVGAWASSPALNDANGDAGDSLTGGADGSSAQTNGASLRLLKTTTDENGGKWLEYTSSQGWTTATIAPNKATTTFLYDALGQLLASTDPDTMTTTYKYDGFGHQIERNHPDAGTTKWQYDNAGNLIATQTQRQINDNTQTNYVYDYGRLIRTEYPKHPQLNVSYQYDEVGRLAKRSDITGSIAYQYDELGNIIQENRQIILPNEQKMYNFEMRYGYDMLGRIMWFIYPDGEEVNYTYQNGQLIKVGNYATGMKYDEYDKLTEMKYGNQIKTNYGYDVSRQWLKSQMLTGNNLTSQTDYRYDNVGNIVSKSDNIKAKRLNGVPITIPATTAYYSYDAVNRLTSSSYRDYYSSNKDIPFYYYAVSYTPSGMITSKYAYLYKQPSRYPVDISKSDLHYGYGGSHRSTSVSSGNRNHQIQTIYDMSIGDTIRLTWDADGQLSTMHRVNKDGEVRGSRTHLWNENGQMAMFMDDKAAGYYGYDGNGERVYKLTGYIYDYDYNAGQDSTRVYFNDAVLYVNPYFIVTPKGYTKHYYNGSQRLASVVEDVSALSDSIVTTGGADGSSAQTMPSLSQRKSEEYMRSFANGDTLMKVQVQVEENMLLPVLSKEKADSVKNYVLKDNTYYYHADHLGSASWITDGKGDIIEHRRYLPYGEEWYHKKFNESDYSERYKFTGKERDEESGYDYFGARYYDSRLLTSWLSIDRKAKPNESPYLYCSSNPLIIKDPDGNFGISMHQEIVSTAFSQSGLNIVAKGRLIWGTGVKADIGNYFTSSVHLDNMSGTFDLMNAYNGAIESFTTNMEKGDYGNAGLALHTIADFYAHSNYIELYQQYADENGLSMDIGDIPTFSEAMKDANLMKHLDEKGLKTGVYNSWREDRNSTDPNSHNMMNKDKSTSERGRVTYKGDKTFFDAARSTAQKEINKLAGKEQ